MSRGYTGVNKIAIGHNNIVGLKTWDALSPPMFKGFNFVKTDWKDTAKRMNGDMRFSDFGIQSTTLNFEALTECEIQYIMDTFFNGGLNRDCLVTIKTQDRNTYRWSYYNATMERPSIGESMDDSLLGPENVKITLWSLVKIL